MGWWELAGEWEKALEVGIEHGQLAARLAAFASERKLKPISVQKAVSVRRFVEELGQAGGRLLSDPRGLASVPLANVEALKRLARYGPEHVAELLDEVLTGKLKGKDLKKEERKIRHQAWRLSRASPNTHVVRLKALSFREQALERLPELYPTPARCTGEVGWLVSSLVVVTDAVVAHENGYTGVRFVAAASGSEESARLRSALQVGLANSRLFHEYVFVCQQRCDADKLATLFRTVPPCGVGVVWLDGLSGAPVRVLEPARQVPPDLAVRFYGVFGSLNYEKRSASTSRSASPGRTLVPISNPHSHLGFSNT